MDWAELATIVLQTTGPLGLFGSIVWWALHTHSKREERVLAAIETRLDQNGQALAVLLDRHLTRPDAG